MAGGPQDEIAELKERLGIDILHGTECDILEDERLDRPDAVLARLDVVVASVHERHRMDEEAMTRRLLRGMRDERFKIWGHALGRLLLRRPPIARRVEEILDAVAESRAAIEINSDPRRLDMEPRWIREARARGIRLVISTDAHSVGQLENATWGIAMARRGFVTPGEVLNAMDARAFRDAVHP